MPPIGPGLKTHDSAPMSAVVSLPYIFTLPSRGPSGPLRLTRAGFWAIHNGPPSYGARDSDPVQSAPAMTPRPEEPSGVPAQL